MMEKTVLFIVEQCRRDRIRFYESMGDDIHETQQGILDWLRHVSPEILLHRSYHVRNMLLELGYSVPQ